MGRYLIASAVLAVLFGAFWTFARPADNDMIFLYNGKGVFLAIRPDGGVYATTDMADHNGECNIQIN